VRQGGVAQAAPALGAQRGQVDGANDNPSMRVVRSAMPRRSVGFAKSNWQTAA
jgi:hypothetical protein